jgi:hypothetical protein
MLTLTRAARGGEVSHAQAWSVDVGAASHVSTTLHPLEAGALPLGVRARMGMGTPPPTARTPVDLSPPVNAAMRGARPRSWRLHGVR